MFGSHRTRHILEVLAPIVLTSEALAKHSLKEIHFTEVVDRSLDRCPWAARLVFFLGLWIFDLMPLFTRGKRFSKLGESESQEYFARWSRRRTLVAFAFLRPLTVFIATAYYSNPDVCADLGYSEKLAPARFKADTSGVLPTPPCDIEMEVEVCVIGSGAGGAVAAFELARQGRQVLVLEEGPVITPDEIAAVPTLERNLRLYRDGGFFASLGLPPVIIPTGRAVGGTTLINSGTCYRTPQKVLARWQKQFGLEDLGADALDPYFSEIENLLGVGPVSEENLGGNNKVIRRGIEALNLHGGPLARNERGCVGSGECIFGCPTGSKQSVERSVLPLAFAAGAKLYANCRVEKLDHEFGRVHRIRAAFTEPSSGKILNYLTIYPKKVVVAAGTLHTPVLLQKSGLGKRSGELGKNLTLHPTAKIAGLFDEVVDGFRGVPQGFSLDDFETEGLLFETVFFPPWLMATSLGLPPRRHYEVMRAYRHLAVFGFLVHDECRGRVCVGPGGRPLVFYNLGKRETELFARGLHILGEVLFAAGAKSIFPTVRNIHELRTPAELSKLKNIRPADLETAAFHPLGTCRMGSSPLESVVDANQKLHDSENVWVMDGSVFPTSLGVNPQITIMAFALRAARKIL